MGHVLPGSKLLLARALECIFLVPACKRRNCGQGNRVKNDLLRLQFKVQKVLCFIVSFYCFKVFWAQNEAGTNLNEVFESMATAVD